MLAAVHEAKVALDSGEFPVGCALVHHDHIVSTGYRVNSQAGGNELDHAEIVALRKLKKNRPGFDLSDVVAYSTMEPCLMCFATLILNGVRTIVYGYEDVMGGSTKFDLSTVAPLYESMSISVFSGVCRSQCLELFRSFFEDEKNRYWHDSLLARYTMEQNHTTPD